MSGPVPKKDAERRRRNKSPEAEGSLSHIPADVVNVDELLVGEVEIPTPDEDWHPIALLIYESQMRSGQVAWMEPSDWSALYLLCESISRDLSPQEVRVGETKHEDGSTTYLFENRYKTVPGANLNAYLKGFSELLVAEGSRRKLRIELERQRRLDAAASDRDNVVDIVKKRDELFG